MNTGAFSVVSQWNKNTGKAMDEIYKNNVNTAPKRAFVIPVLDYSPASEYNICTLLEDLENVEGEVIVVFNGAEIGEDLKHHPRITRYAIMKQNVGVARGWNIGLQMAEADLVHILNADLHLKPEAVYALETVMSSYDSAVCAGPQGSFVNFANSCDYKYFDKGSFNSPLNVDAVSGFFFCVNQRLMSEHGIAFENRFTPCYFEEWDFGLQALSNGLSCWIVPTTGYNHHWSGTIRALRTIPYMGREATASEVLERNRQIFTCKWLNRLGTGDLESGWKAHLKQQLARYLENADYEGLRESVVLLERDFPTDTDLKIYQRFCSLQDLKQNFG